MRLLRYIFARRPFRNFLKRFDDSNVDDALLHYLVSTLFTSPLALFASMAMGALVTVMAWLMTHEPIFIFYMFLHIVIGAARLDILRRFKHGSYPTHTREKTLRFDRHFLFRSALYSVVLGCTAYSLIGLSNVANAAPLAVGICVGFTMAFVNRSASRIRLFSLQVLGTATPAAFAFLFLGIQNGALYATGLVGLVISSMIVGHANLGKTIALYRAGEQNGRMARIDTLTGLANRFAFSEALDAALAQGDKCNSFAICIVDLDRFKEINDTLGHNAGDRVIVDMGVRIRETIRPDDRLARLGGDEFVVLARNDFGGASFGAETAERIVEALSKPLVHDGMPLPASASVGVALYPDHGATAEELLKKADIALYEAKHGGRNIFRVFDASMQSKINDARLFELDIQSVIEGSQFEPWFQPIQNIRTGSAIGYEALARWRHPRVGMIAPNRFIPVAEQSGAIFAISEQILEKACRAATSWDRHMVVCVNLSPVQFRRPQHLVETVKQVLLKTGLEPQRLYLEITESLLMEDTNKTRAAVRELADFGVKFSLDDFGVGYSSLAYIRHYPFSKIKIDKSFTDNIDSDETSSAIIAAVCVLAERTGLEIVAEGIETLQQHVALLEFGLNLAQGYLYGKSAPFVAEVKARVVNG